MHSTQPFFMTVLPCNIPYDLEVLLKIREIVSGSVTYLTRHEPIPVTVLATRPPDLAPFLSNFDCPYGTSKENKKNFRYLTEKKTLNISRKNKKTSSTSQKNIKNLTKSTPKLC